MNYAAGEPNQVFNGIAAAPGFASGTSLLWHKESITFERMTGRNPQYERQRIDKSIKLAQKELIALRDQMINEKHEAEAVVFDAHILMLEDPSLLQYIDGLLEKTVNAEAAWMDGIHFFSEQLASIPDATLQARAADLKDSGLRVLRHLLGRNEGNQFVIPHPSVLIARDLAPSETAGMDKSKVLAFCTAEGGPTSHTAILAKAYGIPAVVGLGDDILNIPNGTMLLVDGKNGKVIVNPDEETISSFLLRKRQECEKEEIEYKMAHEPATTADGYTVEVVANVGNPEEAEKALCYGGEGVGLFRTEFIFLDRQTEPSEEEQYAAYRNLLEIMENRPVVVRTLDIGGDKDIPYLDLEKEENPFLGWRAVRMCLDRPEFFKKQLRALWRAGLGHDLRIMFPMIATLDEVHKAKSILMEARDEVIQAGYTVVDKIQVGIMVEVPSVVVLAEQFARYVDFFSIGTNDLTQYTLAAERTNPKVAHLGDACHPSVLRQIKTVIEAGHAAGLWVGVCGELAGDPEAIPVLLGLGLDEFSMAPRAIPHAKAIIRRWTKKQAADLAKQVLTLESAEQVRLAVRNYHI